MSNPRRDTILAAIDSFGRRVEAGKVAEPRLPRAKRTKPDTPTEYAEQSVVVDWMKQHQVLFFAVPNGSFLAGNSATDRAIRWRTMARIGAKSGVPDLCIVTRPPVDLSARVMVEMKRAHGGRMSEEQLAWKQLLEGEGWRVIVGHGADDAIRQLVALGYGR